MSSRRRSSAASEASSFASNRAYCGYSPSPYVRNTTTTAPSSSRSSKSSYATAVSGSSFASNRAVRNYSPAVAFPRNSNRRFTSNNPLFRTPPLKFTISETTGSGSSSSSFASRSSADSVSSFASNRAVHNYAPVSTSSWNSNRLTRDPFRRSMASGSDFVSNLAVYGYDPPLSSAMNSRRLTLDRLANNVARLSGSWHSSASSYNLSSTMNSSLLTQLSNYVETGSRHTNIYGNYNFVRSSESLENPTNDSSYSHPTSNNGHDHDPVCWPLDAGINSRRQTLCSYGNDPWLPKVRDNNTSYSVSLVIFVFCIVFLWFFKYYM